MEPPKKQINFEHIVSSSFPSSQGHNLGNFGLKSKSRVSMEGQDQYQAACMNRKGHSSLKCSKKLIEQKVRVYISPTVVVTLFLCFANPNLGFAPNVQGHLMILEWKRRGKQKKSFKAVD